MRILISFPGLHRVARGAEVAMEAVASGLSARGHDVTVYGSGPALDRSYRYRRIPVIPRERFERWPAGPFVRDPSSYESIVFNVGVALRYRPSRYDLTLSCGFPWDNLVLRRPRLGRRRPPHVFVTENGDLPAASDKSEMRLFGTDGLVCTNPVYFERNRERYRCALIPNGVDTSRFGPGPAARQALSLPTDVPIVLMVSALAPNKRVDEGIEAVARLDDAILVVAGAGPLGPSLDAHAADVLPGRFIRRTFAHDEMPLVYRSADVLFHPTRFESFGNIYIEAMASGLPVVAHRSAVTEWIFGASGRLVDADDRSEVVSALGSILDGSAAVDRAALVEAARSRFAWSAVVDEYERFLQSVVS